MDGTSLVSSAGGVFLGFWPEVCFNKSYDQTEELVFLLDTVPPFLGNLIFMNYISE